MSIVICNVIPARLAGLQRIETCARPENACEKWSTASTSEVSIVSISRSVLEA